MKSEMADAIKNFFKKKKVEIKFKHAGPGHKLNDSSSSRPEVDRPVLAVARQGLSQESKVAAEAALSRLEQKRENPAFNTSLAAIRAKVRRELEDEKNIATQLEECMITAKTEVQIAQEQELPKNMAASGVYFGCSMVSNEILPRDEWKKKISSFLYEQIEVERGLTSCLIIHSCNYNKEKIETCVETLCKYLENIVTYPEEDKYQKIRMSNRAFTERVLPIEGSMEFLKAAGFERQTIENENGTSDDYLVFNKDNVESIEGLISLIEALRSAEPIHLELDRNLQVLSPSQALVKVNLPPTFFAMTSEEIKREQQLRREAIERNQMLRTKAMREKDELREMKKYKFAIIRIRFPDDILLQGTFSVYECYNDIYEFIQENLEHSGLPFVLNSPTGEKLNPEEHGTKTLIDLRLVPATVLKFAWDSSVAEKINNSQGKDVFLKPEIMVLVQEV